MNIYPGTEWKIEAYRALSYLHERANVNNAPSFRDSLSEALDENLFRECVWCGETLSAYYASAGWQWDHFPPRPENAIGGHKAEPISVYAQRLPALKAIAP